MKGLALLLQVVLLTAGSASWASPALPVPSLNQSILYGVLILAFLGMTVGVLAGTKRRLNILMTAAGGFFLGPLAFLLFFVPKRPSERIQHPDVEVRGDRGSRGLKRESQAPPAEKKPPKRTRKPEQPLGLSSEFAQYSEMLRQTMPGALRRQPINYAEKLVKDEGIRCSNPECNRLLLPPHQTCPHCGRSQT